MKAINKYLLLGILIIAISILLFSLVRNQPEEEILRPIPTIALTPTPTVSPTPSPAPSPSPSPTPTMTPTPTPLPQPIYNPEQINAFIEIYADQYAIDPNVLRHVAICESNFNPLAVNGPYVGLYQFDPTTWQNNRQLMGENTNPGLRFNAEEAIRTAAFVISIGRGGIWPNCFP